VSRLSVCLSGSFLNSTTKRLWQIDINKGGPCVTNKLVLKSKRKDQGYKVIPRLHMKWLVGCSTNMMAKFPKVRMNGHVILGQRSRSLRYAKLRYRRACNPKTKRLCISKISNYDTYNEDAVLRSEIKWQRNHAPLHSSVSYDEVFASFLPCNVRQHKKASIRWQDSARRQFQAGLKGDVGL